MLFDDSKYARRLLDGSVDVVGKFIGTYILSYTSHQTLYKALRFEFRDRVLDLFDSRVDLDYTIEFLGQFFVSWIPSELD
ncbi:MAG: hypothetical protein F4227_06935 [Gammaproteobacteria bacterium]|nr:hypothetical protein [Gammaproteobacteria bacterium]MYF02693.1 hypothetical protein [Gammaproteobacteria bacterium]MYI76500.1 hypothetical protein [Gammaproteobacteria bacterium]